MQLYDILDRGVATSTRVVGSAATSAGDLVADSAVQATGASTKVVERSSKSPAFAAAMLALASLGALVAMRRVFSGAIS